MQDLESKVCNFSKETNIELQLKRRAEKNDKRKKLCWRCRKKYEPDGEKKTYPRHSTGKHRGAVRQSCNLNVQKVQSSFVHILFYNFSEYDSQLFIKKNQPT